ncbi:diacylglycerol kinase family protein [soil metagenome]
MTALDAPDDHPRRRRAVLLTNPRAQAVSPRLRRGVTAILSTALDVREVRTEGSGHATDVARAAAAGDEADVLVCLGGDGTLTEVVNGIAGSDLPLAVLPGGGANVMARSLGMPRDPVRAARWLLPRLAGRPRRIPLGRVAGRYFASNCGLGFDAAVVRGVERHPRLKRRLGEIAYVGEGLRVFFAGYDRTRAHVDISWGSELEHRRNGLYLAIVQNIDPYTFLGGRGIRLCPQAGLEAALDVFGLATMRTTHVLGVLLSALDLLPHGRPQVTSLSNQTRIGLRSDVPLPFQMDGEFVGERAEMIVESVPDALSILG